jgi:hypothetical protein
MPVIVLAPGATHSPTGREVTNSPPSSSVRRGTPLRPKLTAMAVVWSESWIEFTGFGMV